MNQALVYVLVINWNGEEHLEECFASLLETTYPNVRFLLVDNASTDGSVGFLRERFGHDERVEILELTENMGWSRGNNAGMERAIEGGASYILLLNNDTVTDSQAVEHLVVMAEQRPGVGALAPKILLYQTPELLNSVGLEASVTGSSWDRGLGRVDGTRWNSVEQVVGVCGAACFLRVETLHKTGLLPIDFDIYLDDLDLCLRIWDAGYEILTCPEASFQHKFSATMGQGALLRRKYYLNTRNRLRVIQRNYPINKALAICSSFLHGECRAVGRAILEGQPWRVWSHVRAWGAAVAYVPAAIRERRRRKHMGMDTCRFWPLVRTDLQFFPGIELPEDGWYAPRLVDGRQLRPMSVRAQYRNESKELRLTQVNCHPELGPLDVQVMLNKHLVATLDTTSQEETTLALEPGLLEFEAQKIFEAEETGEAVDLGGWVALDSV